MTQGKLVRDRIPEMIESKGEMADSRRLTDEEHEPGLLDKLLEESRELATFTKPRLAKAV